ncbi:hypothetical protein ZWY2020_016012 [Hordeum vulgare]|nr:hypothetical protein ZWY2020_016012 [Hordeum vulgare]
MQMLCELVENLGYEAAGRIDIYLLLPGMQMNEGGLKLLSSNNDTNIIREVVRQGYKYLMFYLDHVDSYVGGGWDDVVANPHLPLEISPQKSSRGESTCEGISRGRRNRSAIIEEREDEGSTSNSDDSDYDPKELVDIYYDLQDGDKDLVMDEPHVADDEKKGLKPKKKGQKNRVRAEPEVSSDEEAHVITQEPNLQTMELAHHDPLNYEDTIISSLMEEHQACQNLEQREPDPMPGFSFIADHVQSQSPVQPTTITKEGNVIRKREVLAIAKLRAAAEKREIADQAKFNAAMAKLREEELKILQAEQKRKEQTATKKLEKEEKQKALLQQKQLAAEERRKAAEERKQKAQQEKEAKKALADNKKQAIQARKKQHQACQNLEQREPDPMPGSSFIADHVESQSPVQPTTLTMRIDPLIDPRNNRE